MVPTTTTYIGVYTHRANTSYKKNSHVTCKTLKKKQIHLHRTYNYSVCEHGPNNNNLYRSIYTQSEY